MFVKAIQDLRLALNNLRDFDNELQSKYGGEIKWTNIYNEFAHTYSWKVDYDPRANLLYLIMGLEPPLDQGRSVETNAKLEGDIVYDGSRPMRFYSHQNWTLVHAYFANMGGLLYLDEDRIFPSYMLRPWPSLRLARRLPTKGIGSSRRRYRGQEQGRLASQVPYYPTGRVAGRL